MSAFHSAAVAHHARMTAPEFADGPFCHLAAKAEGKAGDPL